jgi:hypothetical protein
LGAAVGVACWAVFAVGTRPQDIEMGPLFGLTALTAVGLAFLFDVPPRVAGLPVALVPLLVALWTAPRGDHDGLWAVVLGYLAGWAVILVGLCEGLQRWRSRRRWAAPADRLVDRHPRIAGGLTAAAGVAAAALLYAVFPDPWPAMEARLETFPVPDGFRDREVRRSGDPRCEPDVACGPELTRVLTTNLEGPAACAALEAAMRRWQQPVAVASGYPIHAPPHYFEICAFTADSPDGRTSAVHAVISQPAGHDPEAQVAVGPGHD